MNLLIKYVLVGFIVLNYSLIVNGQDTIHIKTRMNLIHFDCATSVILGAYAFNFERRIVSKNHIKLAVNAGVGGWYLAFISKNYYGYAIPVSLNTLFGSRNSYLEVDMGVRCLTFSKNSAHDSSPFLPNFNTGYRYQKPNGQGLVFRFFIGTTGIGFGLGKAF